MSTPTITTVDKASKPRRIHDVVWTRTAALAAADRRPIADQLDLLVDEALRARGLPGLFETTQPATATG